MNSQADAILARLQQTPGAWIPMPTLAEEPAKYGLSKAYAVHSRISELRERGYDIDNETVNGKSRYRLNVGQRDMFGRKHRDGVQL